MHSLKITIHLHSLIPPSREPPLLVDKNNRLDSGMDECRDPEGSQTTLNIRKNHPKGSHPHNVFCVSVIDTVYNIHLYIYNIYI